MGPYPTSATVELTLTSSGPLLNSGPGKTITVRVPGVGDTSVKEARDWGRAMIGTYRDVPTGRDVVTARFVTPAGPVPARVAAYVKSGAVGGAAVWLAPAAQQTIQWQASVTDLHSRSVQVGDLYVLP